MPSTECLGIIAAITPQVMFTARKTRKMNMFLDLWYTACNRAIMMTCTMFQSSQYHRGIAAHRPAWQLRPNLSHSMCSEWYCLKHRISDHSHTGIKHSNSHLSSHYVEPSSMVRISLTPSYECIQWMGMIILQNTHYICQRNQWHTYCVLPVRRIEHSAYETYSECWYWQYEIGH